VKGRGSEEGTGAPNKGPEQREECAPRKTRSKGSLDVVRAARGVWVAEWEGVHEAKDGAGGRFMARNELCSLTLCSAANGLDGVLRTARRQSWVCSFLALGNAWQLALSQLTSNGVLRTLVSLLTLPLGRRS
jgi:hypothetical protein